jgi:hypothetical protein
MTTNRDGLAEFSLQKLLLVHGEQLAAHHQWISEEDRWFELIFSLLVTACDLPEWQVRGVVDRIASIRLLSIDALADPDGVALGRAKAMAIEGGLGADGVEGALNAAAEAARAVKRDYGGKLQKLLRAESERLLNSITVAFGIDSLTRDQTGAALTYWLQNIMNAPLSLRDGDLAGFAQAQGLSPDDVIRGADSLDLNIALVDDLIRLNAFQIEATKQVE